jgi:hypothetical protein
VQPPVRCSVQGSTGLTLPRQTLEVSHSTGEANGLATGSGTLTSDMIDLTIHLNTIGFATPDGGSMSTVDYHITGKRQ